jgi:hypothetical protein
MVGGGEGDLIGGGAGVGGGQQQFGACVEGTGRSGGEVGMVRAHMSARWFCRQNSEGAEPWGGALPLRVF